MQQFIQLSITQLGNSPKRLWPFPNPSSDLLRHLVGQQEQLFFICVENVCQLVDELLARKVAEVEILVLDFRDVGIADADLRRQVPLGQSPLRAKLMNSFAEMHYRFTLLIACLVQILYLTCTF